MELMDHLFQHEAGRMVAVLASDWTPQPRARGRPCPVRLLADARGVGIPVEFPRTRRPGSRRPQRIALDVLRRERTARTYEPELGRVLDSEWTLSPVGQETFTENSKDKRVTI